MGLYLVDSKVALIESSKVGSVSTLRPVRARVLAPRIIESSAFLEIHACSN